jgi:hypothetical protein
MAGFLLHESNQWSQVSWKRKAYSYACKPIPGTLFFGYLWFHTPWLPLCCSDFLMKSGFNGSEDLMKEKTIDSFGVPLSGLIIPKTLDEIIRENRHLVRLYLTKDAEIAGLTKAIVNVNGVKDELADWRFVTLDAGDVGSKVVLLGDALQRRETWITSRVVAIDFGTRIVATENSIYRLSGDRGKGEPPINHLLHVCSAIHSWGAGRHLGVLDVFY